MRIAILLGLSSIALAAAVGEDGAPAEDREGKFWWPKVTVQSMWNTTCDTDGGYKGWCYKSTECLLRGGTADGTCAEDALVVPGVCCDLNSGGNTTIGPESGSFTNKGYPDGNSRSGQDTVAELNPPAGTVQVKLTFDEFDITPPVDGDCTNDTFTFEGANSNIEVPVLCGCNTGQHMYIDVDNSDGPWMLKANIGEGDYERKFKVTVDFLQVDDDDRAPFRCLQYYPDKEGSMSSFNYNADKDSMMLNNQKYTICFGYVSGKCDIMVTAPRFDLGSTSGTCDDDYLRVSSNTYCGDLEDFSFQANATGPVTFLVSSDDENALQEEGFTADYTMAECA